MPGMSAEAARAFFPRGLVQPVGSFRFSLEALLLASFLAPGRQDAGERLLDLGTGCGVVALGMLCRHPALEAYGVEVQPELAEAARSNAARLGLADRFTVLCHDIADPEFLPEPPGAFSLILANPPYRQRHRGRLPASPSRLTALFETESTLTAFCRAAARAMTPDGRFGLIFPAAREDYLLSALAGAGFVPIRLLPVRARPDDPAMLMLVESIKPVMAQKQNMPKKKTDTCTQYETPLVLYRERSATPQLTEQATAFCPFLACNG